MVWNHTVPTPVTQHQCRHALYVYVCSVNSIIIANYFQLIFLYVAGREAKGKRTREDFSVDAGRHWIVDESSFVRNHALYHVVEIVLYAFSFLVLFVPHIQWQSVCHTFCECGRKKQRRRSKDRWRKAFRRTTLILEIFFFALDRLEFKPITVDNAFRLMQKSGYQYEFKRRLETFTTN